MPSAVPRLDGSQELDEQPPTDVQLQRMNRELRAIRECIQLAMRAHDEQHLLNDVCNVICEKAGYRMAWVGYVEHDEACSVRPVAWAGAEHGYLASAKITWADNERGQGPGGLAVRTGTSHCIQDFATDARAVPWREKALAFGYRSAISLPLVDEKGITFGLLGIYSTEPNAFVPQEVRLLEELAADLVFGITSLRARNERDRAEKAFRESEARFGAAFHASPNLIAITTLDGVLVEVNERYSQVLGYSREESLGRSTSELSIWANPDDRTTFLSALRQDGHITDFETVLRRKDGGVVTVLDSARAFTVGGQTCILSVVHDISERKRAEEALRESEQRYRALFEESPVAMWEEDFSAVKALLAELAKQGIHSLEDYLAQNPEVVRRCADLVRIVEVNRASVDLHRAGSKEDLLAGLANTFTPESFETFKQELLCLWHGTHAMTSDAVVKTLDGQPRNVTISFAVCPGAEESLAKVLVSIVDVTERKAAEAEVRRLNQELEARIVQRTSQLEMANKELEAFAYSVSHDLRAPLRHIHGFIELLRSRIVGTLDAQSVHYMDNISASSVRMGSLVDDLLAFSRMGRQELSEGRVDLSELTQSVLRELQQETQGRPPIRWTVAPLPQVNGDAAMLRLVLVNLLSNALKFTRGREHAEITVGWEARPTEIVVYVRDNGVGFDMRYVDRLFGVFQRLHRMDEFEGTGIGLASVRRIVGRHGGRTWAEAKLNEGATFYFSLPHKQA